jgi:hypothetical protein
MTATFFVRTQYDGKDYRSVEEVFTFDEDGEEQVDQKVTALCIDITTCADQGVDTWTFIKDQIEARLKKAGTPYDEIHFDE